MGTTATFRINSVTCKDEMGNWLREKLGNDEIRAVVFSADLRGATRQSKVLKIYDNFDDGETMTFSDPLRAVTLDLAGAQGDLELTFAVHLFESQLVDGDWISKSWKAWTDTYGEALKDELKKINMDENKAREIAQGDWLAPKSGQPEGSVPEDVIGGASDGTGSTSASSGSGTSASAAAEGTVDEPKDEKSTTEKLGDAFIAAAITAAAIYLVKSIDAIAGGIWAWAKDSTFPPATTKVKVNGGASVEEVPPNATGVLEFVGHDGRYTLSWDVLVTPG